MLRTVIAVALAALFVIAVSAGDPDTAEEAERVPTASDAYTFDSPVLNLKWVNDEKGKPTIVILQTREGYIHKSLDSGRNWQPLSDLIKPEAVVAPAKKSKKSKSSSKKNLIQKMSVARTPAMLFSTADSSCCIACYHSLTAFHQLHFPRRQQHRHLHIFWRHHARDDRPLLDICHQAYSRIEQVR